MLEANLETCCVTSRKSAVTKQNTMWPAIYYQTSRFFLVVPVVYRSMCCPCRAGAESDADTAEIPPVRSGCLPVTVEFTKLETEHLPARETREQEISSYKRKAQVRAAIQTLVPIK